MSATNTTHTPGPYSLQVIEHGHNGYQDWRVYGVRSPQNVCLAVVGQVDRYESERIPANAALFQAAPDLLEALKVAREYIRGNMNAGDFTWNDWADSYVVDAAIEKAEGSA